MSWVRIKLPRLQNQGDTWQITRHFIYAGCTRLHVSGLPDGVFEWLNTPPQILITSRFHVVGHNILHWYQVVEKGGLQRRRVRVVRHLLCIGPVIVVNKPYRIAIENGDIVLLIIGKDNLRLPKCHLVRFRPQSRIKFPLPLALVTMMIVPFLPLSGWHVP